MKLFSKSLLAGLAALALAPASASALPPDCDYQCTETPACWLVCTVPWGSRVITCGEWYEDWGGEACTAAREDIEESLVSMDEEEANASFECTEQQ